MNKTLANLLAKAHRLESTLTARIEGAARRASAASTREPLEVVHAIVDAVGREIQPAGRGRQAFPFNQVRVVALAATPREKARLQVAFEGPPTLHERIVSHLKAAGCAEPPLALHVTFVAKRGAEWFDPAFHVTYARVAHMPAAESHVGQGFSPAQAHLELIVTHGVTTQQTYTFESSTIAIGRGDEVRDSRHQLIRTNDVVFAEGGGDINETVSRRHARIELEPSGSFRLYDEGSAQGTSIVRRGRAIPIPRGTRGIRVQPGDEIVLGRARVRVAMVASPPRS
jgi:FHA domain